MNKGYIIAIDQGTSGTKTLVFDGEGKVCAKGTEILKTQYLENGFVEQDPQEILENVLSSVKNCIQSLIDNGKSPEDIVACGISNQRETFVIWNKEGKPYNAVEG